MQRTCRTAAASLGAQTRRGLGSCALPTHREPPFVYNWGVLRTPLFYLIKSLCNCTFAAPQPLVPQSKRSTGLASLELDQGIRRTSVGRDQIRTPQKRSRQGMENLFCIPLRATAVDAERPVTAHRRGFNFSDQGIPFAEKKVCKVCAGIHKACQPKGFLCPDELCGSTLFGASHNEPHSRVVKKQYCSCGCLLCKRQDGGRKRLQMATPSSQN